MKAKEPNKPTSIRLPDSLKVKIVKAAKDSGQTFTGRIIFLLDKAHK
jgi:hypothetical protein